MTASDPRLDELAALIIRLAGGEYDARGMPTDRRDEIDAVMVGLNLLAETLQQERAARQAAESLLRDAVHAYEHAPGMFCSVDAGTWRIVKCNETFATTLGVPKQALLSRPLLDFVASGQHQSFTEALDAVCRGDAPKLYDFQILGTDGRSCRVAMAASLASEEGGPPRVRLILRDVSEERSLEAQLRQAQKMEAVGRLASGVAHDFNNILTVVLTAGYLVSKTLGEQHQRAPEVRMILDAGERAAAITRQLLAFGRTEIALPQTHDLNGLVEDARGMLTRILGEQLRLELVLHPNPLPVRIDATQLTQVLVNLAINARDAMSRGGVFTVETLPEESEHGLTAVVRSVDTGSGMSVEVMERAFEPFFTTKETSGGSGLGLAVCYGIVQRAGGSILLSSESGEGTTVKIALPITELRSRRAEASRSKSSHRGHGEKILLVDDADAVRESVGRTLVSAGYDVTFAPGGRAALEQIARGCQPDLLVTDVVMPDLSGPELARLVWEKTPRLPVLFMSGYTGDRVDAALLERPGVAFLQKPFDGARLTQVIDELLAGADKPDQSPG